MKNHGDDLRRAFLWTMIAMFSLTGVTGAVTLLMGVDSGAAFKVMLTSASIGGFSLLGMVSARCLSKARPESMVARVGVIASTLSAVFATAVIWAPLDAWRGTVDLALLSTIASVACAHSLLIWGPNHSELGRSITLGTVGLIVIVAGMLAIAVLGDFDVGAFYWRILGFFAALDAAATVVTVLLRRVQAPAAAN